MRGVDGRNEHGGEVRDPGPGLPAVPRGIEHPEGAPRQDDGCSGARHDLNDRLARQPRLLPGRGTVGGTEDAVGRGCIRNRVCDLEVSDRSDVRGSVRRPHVFLGRRDGRHGNEKEHPEDAAKRSQERIWLVHRRPPLPVTSLLRRRRSRSCLEKCGEKPDGDQNRFLSPLHDFLLLKASIPCTRQAAGGQTGLQSAIRQWTQMDEAPIWRPFRRNGARYAKIRWVPDDR